MTNEDRNPLTETDLSPEALPADDDLRFAPAEAAHEAALAGEAEPRDEVAVFPVADGVDIEAALAAVSTLSDMLAEQEAAEQAKIAQAEAEARAAEERRMRLEHPELFFPVPPQIVLKRGQMASVVPALLLMAIGAWLTFAQTTSPTSRDGGLVAALLIGGVAVTFIARWLSSGRWERGSLFTALALLLVAGVAFYLTLPGSPGSVRGWPLLVSAVGTAFILTALLAYPSDRRLLLPGLLLVIAGLIGLTVTLGLLPTAVTAVVVNLWPVVLALVLLVWLLPVLRRR
ncbi:MAG: hypothetical protein HZC41_02110 [Chloroflexi bacterium]|nr:hypothetical protein [Chloroflexota bacterium]